MSFFDDLGKKISTASQVAVAKTKDFADVTRLNSEIAAEQSRIQKAYSEIGKMYYEIHSNDFEPCFEEYFISINEANEKIKDYEQQIVDIKGVIKCPNCGAEVVKTVAFCASCGNPILQKVEAVEENQTSLEKKCPTCGEVVDINAAFCTKCGTKIIEE